MTERREFIYTTIGDMVKDSRALGYDYMPPKHADLSREDYQEWPQHCYIVFSGVRCTKDTYRIDLFINQDNPQPADATLQNPHYVGQIMRLGMGIDDDKGRCISHGVTRVLDASFAAYALELTDSSPSTINMIVTEGTKQRVLPPEEYQQLPGFAPAAVWGASIPAMQRLHQEQQSSSCDSNHCHDTEASVEKEETSMEPLQRFSSPANQAQTDFGSDSTGLGKFRTFWNNNLNRWTNQSIVGNPWSNINDDNRYYYFNPLTSDSKNAQGPVPILWTPFPNRLYNFFQDPNAPQELRFTVQQIHELADTGYVTMTNSSAKLAIGDLQVPATICPASNWQGELTGYTPAGSRGWLDEYCEWSVLRDQNGKIKQVMFTCENPAYWFTLWKTDPQVVLKLYQQHVNPNVQIEDLYLYDQNHSPVPVMDALTGYYAYNPTNKWNSGTQSLPDRGGAIHLTSGPNTLSAEIYLAAAGTIARQCGNDDPQTLICCAKYGRPQRNSDPHIGSVANQVANTADGNVIITLTDPVGLYIQTPNFASWSVKNQPNYQVQDCWKVTRGSVDPTNPGEGNDSILHAVFTVPDGLDAEDILILSSDGNQYPLQWAGQIAETFKIALRVSTLPAPASTPSKPVPQQPRGCVNDAPNPQPWPVQLLPYAMAEAGSPSDLSPDIEQGATATMLLAVQGGQANAEIKFQPSDGITAQVLKFLPNGVSTPGQTSGGGTQAYIFQITVAADAPVGDRDVQVVNPQNQASPGVEAWAPGLLSVVAKS